MQMQMQVVEEEETETETGSDRQQLQHSWLYWQLVAWAQSARESGRPAETSSDNDGDTPVPRATYYGYAPSMEVLLTLTSTGRGPGRQEGGQGEEAAYESAVQRLQESRVANVVASPMPLGTPGAGAAGVGGKAALLREVATVLRAAPELHPFVPALSHPGPAGFYSPHACSLLLERAPSDDAANTAGTGAGTSAGAGGAVGMAMGRLVGPAQSQPATSLSITLNALQRSLHCPPGTPGGPQVQVLPVHDTEGALDSVRAAARLLSLELRCLGAAMRDHRAVQLRRQSSSPSSPSSEMDAGAEALVSAFFAKRGYAQGRDSSASSIKAPLSAINESGALSYLQSRCRSDVAVAQALRGSLGWELPPASQTG